MQYQRLLLIVFPLLAALSVPGAYALSQSHPPATPGAVHARVHRRKGHKQLHLRRIRASSAARPRSQDLLYLWKFALPTEPRAAQAAPAAAVPADSLTSNASVLGAASAAGSDGAAASGSADEGGFVANRSSTAAADTMDADVSGDLDSSELADESNESDAEDSSDWNTTEAAGEAEGGASDAGQNNTDAAGALEANGVNVERVNMVNNMEAEVFGVGEAVGGSEAGVLAGHAEGKDSAGEAKRVAIGAGEDVLEVHRTFTELNRTDLTGLKPYPVGKTVGDVEDIPMPKNMRGNWVVENANGPPSKTCGSRMWLPHLPLCKASDLVTYSSMSKILLDDPGNVSSVVDKAFLLGEGGPHGLTSCRAPRNHKMERRNIRLMVEAQYFNAPRCCKPVEARQLANESSVFVKGAIAGLKRRHAYNMSYYVVEPTSSEACSASSQCAMVVHIPGAGHLLPGNLGNPWMLVQASCELCAQQLRSVVVTPELELDLFHKKGYLKGHSSGSSNSVLLTKLGPWVEGLLRDDAGLDAERVYIVAQSRGCDTAFRAALLFPRIFKTAVLSSYFYINDVTKRMVRREHIVKRAGRGRLRSVQFFVGDRDDVFRSGSFFENMRDVLRHLEPGKPHVDLRIYPEGGHNVWFAAWNSLHEVLWTGARRPHSTPSKIAVTCKPLLFGNLSNSSSRNGSSSSSSNSSIS